MVVVKIYVLEEQQIIVDRRLLNACPLILRYLQRHQEDVFVCKFIPGSIFLLIFRWIHQTINLLPFDEEIKDPLVIKQMIATWSDKILELENSIVIQLHKWCLTFNVQNFADLICRIVAQDLSNKTPMEIAEYFSQGFDSMPVSIARQVQAKNSWCEIEQW